MRNAILLTLAMTISVVAQSAPTAYTLDASQTLPQFEIGRLGFAKLQGFFAQSSGWLLVNRAARTAAMELVVHTGSIYLGAPTRANVHAALADSTSRAPSFLQSEAHPTMLLKAGRIGFEDARPAVAEADITFVGITRPVLLSIDRWHCDRSPAGVETCMAIATATVRRSAFGVKLGYP